MDTHDHFARLISQARAGDPMALGVLFERYAKDLEPFIGKLVDNELPLLRYSDAKQEVFLELYNALQEEPLGFRGNTESEFRAWCRQLSRHKVLKLYRDLRRNKRGGKHVDQDESAACANEPAVSAEQSRDARRKEGIERLQEAMLALTDDEQLAVHLCYLEQKSYAEAAERMEKTVSAVGALLARGLRKLRRVLSDELL